MRFILDTFWDSFMTNYGEETKSSSDPTRLRARGVSAPANSRDERCEIGFVHFTEMHLASLCRDAELSAHKQTPEINPR